MGAARPRARTVLVGLLLAGACSRSEEATPEKTAPVTTSTVPVVRPAPTCTAPPAVPGLRFDGLYVGREQGGDATDAAPIWQFLRFYPDGLVVLAAVQHAGEAPVENVAKWLVRDAKVGSVGCWTIAEGRVTFSVTQRTGEEVRVDFTGTIAPDRLTISWYSHKTKAGSSGDIDYTFASAPG